MNTAAQAGTVADKPVRNKQKEDAKKDQEKVKHYQTKKRLLDPYYRPASGSRYEVLRDLYRTDDS
jgi:hypothetical protein